MRVKKIQKLDLVQQAQHLANITLREKREKTRRGSHQKNEFKENVPD